MTGDIEAVGTELVQKPREPWMSRVVQWLLSLVERRRVAGLLAFSNSLGFLFGMVFWYGGHLIETRQQWYLWPFIPDCPLFAGLFVVAFWGILRGRRWPLFYVITAFGLVKYGMWTVVYTVALWVSTGRLGFMAAAMGLTHLGMILEGVYVSYRLLAPRFGRSPSERPAIAMPMSLAAFAWFLLSDVVDYGLGQYPRFDTTVVSLPLMQWHTVFMTLVLGAIYVALSRLSPGASPPTEAHSPVGGSHAY